MVHALEVIHRLLRSDGCLIDIHPSSEPPTLWVQAAGAQLSVGLLEETDNFIEYQQAQDAITESLRLGLFQREAEADFTFTIHADDLAELQAFLAAEWKDALIPDDVAENIRSIYAGQPGEKRILVQEKILISRYRRQSRQPAMA